MSSNKAAGTLSPEQGRLLIDLAHRSIRHGLAHGKPPVVVLEELDETLCEPRATFVTLTTGADLRGCIGTLEPCRPLAADVVHNAFAAAFHDPRFPPLAERELTTLKLHLSLLTPALPMAFTSEVDLLAQLVPFVDGLVMEEGRRRGTFLPAVWESLPDPRTFLEQLKLKAGLPATYWSASLKVYRYGTEVIEG